MTALQLGEAAEGSRVTIVSDSALNDYEAYRRGDRFYVKIPLAESTSALPHCCGDGFEDVQVQRVGDSLIVSFRLQPGATARVDQRSNRLDVIFSAPNRSLRDNPAKAVRNRVATGTSGSRTSLGRGPDAAGPMPPGSAPAFRERVVTERVRASNQSRAPQDPRGQSNRRNDSNKGASNQSTSTNNQSTSGNNQGTTGNAASRLPSPVPSPSSILTPSNSASAPALTAATPAAHASSQATGNSSSSSRSSSLLNWKTQAKAALQWASGNRLATLLGALILLSLILYLATALRSRQKKVVKAKRAKAPKVQPKYSADGELTELSGPSLNEQTARQVKIDPATARAGSEVVSDRATLPSNVQGQRDSRGQQPVTAPAAAAATAPSYQSVLTTPSIVSPTAGYDEYSSEEEEREVFEL